MTVGHLAEAASTPQAPTPQPGHLRVERRLIDEDKTGRVPIGLLLAPAGPSQRYIRPVLLGGVRRFFLNSGPCA